MSSQLLKVPVKTLKDAADSLLDFYEDESDLFAQVLNLLQTIRARGEWKGAGVDALIGITKSNKKKYAIAMSDLKDLATFLSTYAERMSTEDSNIKTEIQNKMR